MTHPPSPKFVTATEVAASAAFDPEAPAPPRFLVGAPFQNLDIRPGRIVLIGAPPAAGKTAATLQITESVLANNPEVKALIANVEMSPSDLLARIVARLSGVRVDIIGDRKYLPEEKAKVKTTLSLHASTLSRMAFLEPPFDLEHLAETGDAFGANLLVIDYVQRFGHENDQRENLDGLMSGIRRLALAGVAVIVVSSVGRRKDSKGQSTYAGLNLASFRGSAELEFGADSAYILDNLDDAVTLRCVKARYGRPSSIDLQFVGEYQRFDERDAANEICTGLIPHGNAAVVDPLLTLGDSRGVEQ
jgi:replicative DNA helicase